MTVSMHFSADGELVATSVDVQGTTHVQRTRDGSLLRTVGPISGGLAVARDLHPDRRAALAITSGGALVCVDGGGNLRVSAPGSTAWKVAHKGDGPAGNALVAANEQCSAAVLVRQSRAAGQPAGAGPSAITLMRFDSAGAAWPLPRPLAARSTDLWMWLAGDALEVVLRTETGTERWRWRKGQAAAEQQPALAPPEAEIFFAGPLRSGGFVTASRTRNDAPATWLHQPAPWLRAAIAIHDGEGALRSSTPLTGCEQLDCAVTSAGCGADGGWVVSYRVRGAMDMRVAASTEPDAPLLAMVDALEVDPGGRFAAVRPHPKDGEACIVQLADRSVAWAAGANAVARRVEALFRRTPVDELRARDERLSGSQSQATQEPQFDLGALYLRPLRGAKVAEAKVGQAVVDAYQAAGLQRTKLASIPGFRGQQVRAESGALARDCVLVHATQPGWCGVFSWQLELADPREHALALALSKTFEVLGMRSEAGRHVTWTRYRGGKPTQATSVGPEPLDLQLPPLDLAWLAKHLRAPADRPAPTVAELERVLVDPKVVIEGGGVSSMLGFADAIESDGALAADEHLLAFGG